MKRVVLVGGGHANVQVLKILHDKCAQSHPGSLSLTLISSSEFSYYSGMLPGAITTQYPPSDIQVPLRPLAYSCGARFIPSPITRLDPVERTISLESGETVGYDIVCVDIGSRSKGTDSVPGVRGYSLMTRPLNLFFRSIEEREKELMDTGKTPSVGVVGGGVAGVELAFSFASRWMKAFGGRRVDVKLLCDGDRVLPGYPDTFRTVVMKNLQKWEIEVVCGANAAEVTKEGVRLRTGEFLIRDVVVWATGAEPHPIPLGLPLCPKGFLLVNDYLQSPAYPEVFGGGDCISMASQAPGFPPKAGVYAVREGPVIAANIIAMLSGGELERYTPQSDFLCLVNTGDGRALGGKYGIVFAGKWVWALKDYIDRSFMSKYSPIMLLGTKGVVVYHETLGMDMDKVYASREVAQVDYSQQFGLEKDSKLEELERTVEAMTAEEAMRILLDTSDIFGPCDHLEFQLNFQIIKRFGMDDAFRTSCVRFYLSEFSNRLSSSL